MQANTPKPPPVAQLFPPEFRDALVSAGQRADHAMIDAITDQLAMRGYCRQRHADGVARAAAQWAGVRA